MPASKKSASRRNAIPKPLQQKQHNITFEREDFSPLLTERLQQLVQPAQLKNLQPGEVTSTFASALLEIRAGIEKLLKQGQQF